MMDWIRDYVGLPFTYNGRGVTVDCYGLIVRIYAERFKIELPEHTETYSRETDSESIATLIDENFRGRLWRKVRPPELGDVILFNDNGFPAHCGMYIHRGLFIHVQEGARSCIERCDSPYWHHRVAGYFRHVKRVV